MIDLEAEIDDIASWQIENMEPSERIFAYDRLTVIDDELGNMTKCIARRDKILELTARVEELKSKYQEFWGMNNE